MLRELRNSIGYMRRLLVDLVHAEVGGLETWQDVKNGAVEIIDRVIP